MKRQHSYQCTRWKQYRCATGHPSGKATGVKGNLLDAAGESTDVLLLVNAASAYSGDNNGVVDADDEAYGDGRLLAAALMDKIKRTIDDTPLTTAALRALKKEQTGLMYSRTLVCVRLPERVVLQRRFHPRNTLQDVH